MDLTCAVTQGIMLDLTVIHVSRSRSRSRKVAEVAIEVINLLWQT